MREIIVSSKTFSPFLNCFPNLATVEEQLRFRSEAYEKMQQ